VAVDKARGSIQALITQMDEAEKTCDTLQREQMKELAISAFLQTDYGRYAWERVVDKGNVYMPLYKDKEEGERKTSRMIHLMKTYVEDDSGTVKRDWLMSKHEAIKSEPRLMIDPVQVKEELELLLQEVDKQVACVLQAVVVRSGSQRIRVERGNNKCLLSLWSCPRQVRIGYPISLKLNCLGN